MRRLSDAHEHLDGTLADESVLVGNLRDLRRVNRWFGGTSLSIRAIRGLVDHARGRGGPVPGSSVLRVLDVGTGAADIPSQLVAADGPWQSVEITAVDSRPEMLAAARTLDPRLASTPRIRLEVADGRSLPFADRAFDVAHASLVLHHLEPRDAVRFVQELARVSSIGVVVNDLQRSRVGWLWAWLILHAMTGNAYTRHDGPLSVRRAYTHREAEMLLEQAGLRRVETITGLAGHRWAISATTR